MFLGKFDSLRKTGPRWGPGGHATDPACISHSHVSSYMPAAAPGALGTLNNASPRSGMNVHG